MSQKEKIDYLNELVKQKIEKINFENQEMIHLEIKIIKKMISIKKRKLNLENGDFKTPLKRLKYLRKHYHLKYGREFTLKD